MDKLLPCPFCGGEVSIALCGDGFDAWWFITRGHGENACKCRLFMESEKFNKDSEMANFVADDLIAAWNRRAQPENEPLTRCENCTHWDKSISFMMSAHACSYWSPSKRSPRYTEGFEFCSFASAKPVKEVQG